MVKLLRLLMLLFPLETATPRGDEPDNDEPDNDDPPDDEPGDESDVDDVDRPDPDDAWKDIKDAAGVRRKMSALQDQVNRLHRKLERQDTYIERLEKSDEASQALNGSRMQVAFLREVIDRTDNLDLEATWDLAGARLPRHRESERRRRG